MPKSSYQSLEFQDMITKTEGEKTTKNGINRGKKRFSQFLKCFVLNKYEK